MLLFRPFSTLLHSHRLHRASLKLAASLDRLRELEEFYTENYPTDETLWAAEEILKERKRAKSLQQRVAVLKAEGYKS